MNEDEDLDTVLRSWGHDVLVTTAAPSISATRFRTARPYSSWVVPLIAAAVVVVVAAGVVAIRATSSGQRAGTTVAPVGTTGVPIAPAGQRVVVFHGLAVNVPATWTDNDVACGGTPTRNTVVNTFLAGFSCAAGRRPDVSSLWWFRYPSMKNDRTLFTTNGAAADEVIAGSPAKVWQGTSGTLHTIWVDVPHLGVSMLIESPNAKLPKQILRSARLANYDPLGCPTKNGLAGFTDLRRSEIPDAGSSLIPGEPSVILACRYNGGGFEQSAEISPTQLQADVATLNALPEGLSIADPQYYEPKLCEPGSDDPAYLAPDLFVLYVKYRSGQTLTLAAGITLCGKLGITNGSFDAQDSQPLANFLAQTVGISTGFQGGLIPAK